jgi:F0F1-type ATP synthase epsilon subunit
MCKEDTFNLEIWKMETVQFSVPLSEIKPFNYYMIDQGFLQVSANKIQIIADSL